MVSEINRISHGNLVTIELVNKGTQSFNVKKLYEIDSLKNEIKVFRKRAGTGEEFYVLFEGFKGIPEMFSEKSNADDGTLESLYGHAKKFGFKGLIISNFKNNCTEKDNLIINYKSYQKLLEDIKKTKNYQRTLKQRERSKFLKDSFPDIFSGLRTSFPSISNSISKEVIDEEVLKRLEFERLKDIVKASTNVVENKFGKKLNEFHKNITVISNFPVLKKATSELHKLINKSSSKEMDFKKFLIETFPLLRFDCVYLEPELNLICAGAKKSDFLMINSEGFADIFEIKTPKTPMLKFDSSHQNYYWSTEASKAIAQIEKYLHYANQNSFNIKNSLSKKDINLDIVKPKGILIMGSDEELDKKNKGENSNKREDFRILRQSLKNIEILTYSDLLRSLSNLVKSNELKEKEKTNSPSRQDL